MIKHLVTTPDGLDHVNEWEEAFAYVVALKINKKWKVVSYYSTDEEATNDLNIFRSHIIEDKVVLNTEIFTELNKGEEK
jgi:hypothetical protein